MRLFWIQAIKANARRRRVRWAWGCCRERARRTPPIRRRARPAPRPHPIQEFSWMLCAKGVGLAQARPVRAFMPSQNSAYDPAKSCRSHVCVPCAHEGHGKRPRIFPRKYPVCALSHFTIRWNASPRLRVSICPKRQMGNCFDMYPYPEN